MFFGPIILTALLVLVVYVLTRSTEGEGDVYLRKSPKNPLDVLKERFARGEIDRREYDNRRHVLEKN